MLTYHQKTCDLLGLTPRISTIALRWLNQLEEKHGVTFPAAVREFYSIVGLIDLMPLDAGKTYTPLAELGDMFGIEWHMGKGVKQFVIKREQGDFEGWWYIDLTEKTFDPPVQYMSLHSFNAPSIVFSRFSDMTYFDLMALRWLRYRTIHSLQGLSLPKIGHAKNNLRNHPATIKMSVTGTTTYFSMRNWRVVFDADKKMYAHAVDLRSMDSLLKAFRLFFGTLPTVLDASVAINIHLKESLET